ncbi:hypothetical protein TB9_09210 [Xanthomonas perforans]|uniref:Uncharacterized protein n=1 Tax=Xanthomonas perforans TaxID=442694 RepID=A0AAQ0YLP1_XANPE|nr:hypothetical protein BJD13_07595 [Xanthomonas perforans]AYO95324.1 hypothetical protein Xcom_10100 [Xanthomonas axonopodis pv. commiphoreae]OHX23621.1 hypothetical protein BHL63_20925 [Xanthomonas alfalfae]KLC03917.1 hypothetical protein XP420_16190 [Xanthomonas perforans]KLC05601.1 hypothetical protein XP4B_19570 [Xanthomonas perforans]
MIGAVQLQHAAQAALGCMNSAVSAPDARRTRFQGHLRGAVAGRTPSAGAGMRANTHAQGACVVRWQRLNIPRALPITF